MATLKRDGVGLAYEEAGSGNPPVMLAHPWGGDRTWMRPVLERLRKRHRVVSVDLRGFGESDKPEQPYKMTSYADDLAWMAGELGLERPVLIGHSMGGSVVLEAAARHPNLASAVVILESLVVAPPPLVDGFRPLLDAIKTPGAFAPALTQFTEQLTGPFFDPRDRAAMTATITSCAPHVMISCLEDIVADDHSSAAAKCKVPVLYVSSGPWYTDVARFKELCPTLVTAQLVGCGHYFPLEVPDQLHPILARFIETQVVRRAPAT
jgi:pimeloyl-ACP methyl ester carboxylesterase